ncbi:hypothetical protein LMH73_024025 [Vibrio splendidus]|nr:hypothetical protein [Vibrio splendidus]MCC4880692.1 hypothetical protein [Vibrio splendidus]
MIRQKSIISLVELFQVLELVRGKETYGKLYSMMAKLVGTGVSSCSLALVLEALIDSKSIGIGREYKDAKLMPLFDALETEDEMFSLSNSYRLSDNGYLTHAGYEILIYAYFGLFEVFDKLKEEAKAIREGEGLLRKDRVNRFMRFLEGKTRRLLEKTK